MGWAKLNLEEIKRLMEYQIDILKYNINHLDRSWDTSDPMTWADTPMAHKDFRDRLDRLLALIRILEGNPLPEDRPENLT